MADSLVKWHPYDGSLYGPLATCLSKTGQAGDALLYLQLKEALPFEFQSVHVIRSGNRYIVRGQVVGRGGSVGEQLAVPFEFIGRDGEVLVTEEQTLLIPPAGESRAFRLVVESEAPISGFRYSRVDG